MSSTNNTTHAIVSFLGYCGHVAWRNNTAGIFDPVKKCYRQGAVASRGVADILCCLKGGRLLEVEVKYGRDKLNAAQASHRDKIIQAGGLHITVHSYDEFRRYYDAVIMPTLETTR